MDPNEANDSIAKKFTNVMNATPSPLSAFCDVAVASIAAGLVLAVGLFIIRHGADPSRLYLVLAVAACPFLGSYGLQLALRGSRHAIVAWMTTLPFRIDNMNSLLAGMGDTIEVFFERGAELPSRANLSPSSRRFPKTCCS